MFGLSSARNGDTKPHKNKPIKAVKEVIPYSRDMKTHLFCFKSNFLTKVLIAFNIAQYQRFTKHLSRMFLVC
jgi:hypothetical protein